MQQSLTNHGSNPLLITKFDSRHIATQEILKALCNGGRQFLMNISSRPSYVHRLSPDRCHGSCVDFQGQRCLEIQYISKRRTLVTHVYMKRSISLHNSIHTKIEMRKIDVSGSDVHYDNTRLSSRYDLVRQCRDARQHRKIVECGRGHFQKCDLHCNMEETCIATFM